jgi:serine/threonine-protein kinase
MDPKEIGRYKVLRQLGQGAFGDVYLAEDPVMGRHVVIKLARPDVGDVRDRFRAEVRLLRPIESPYVNRVFDTELFEGRACLVSEFIKGPSLAITLEQTGPLPLESALRVARGLAEGLAVAHRNGVIHRDIKPSNVLLREGDFARPVLIDFGIAGFLERESHSTRSGQIFGTAYYMSPEQVMGKPQSATSDIYGLGILLFEMLFGNLPFKADRDIDVFRKVLDGPLTFPDIPAISGSVQQLIRQCLEKDPARRPQSANEFLRIVESVTSESPQRAARGTLSSPIPPSQLPRSSRVAKRSSSSRAWLIGASVGALLVVGLLYLVLSRHLPSNVPNPDLTHPPISAPVPPAHPATRVPLVLALIGIVVALAAFPLGMAIGKWLSKRRNRIEEEATRLLFGARSRQKLTETLAIEVEALVLQLERLDERIVGLSIAIMVDEFRRAKKPEARQKALMQMMELMEKIRYRLTPWYVRHDKLIAIVVSILTCLSGVATAVANIAKPLAHP